MTVCSVIDDIVEEILPFLREKSFIVHNASSYSSTIWPDFSIDKQNVFCVVVQKAIRFLRGYPLIEGPIPLHESELNANLRHKRQNIFRSLGVIGVVMTVLNILLPLSEDGMGSQEPNSATKSIQLMDQLKRFITQILDLLYFLIKDNLANQNIVANQISLILTHATCIKQASKIAEELLAVNLDLHMNQIEKTVIKKFMDKMKIEPLNPMYLHLMKICCSCKVKTYLF